MITKTCAKCGEVKPLDGFHKNKRMRDGRVSHCKECVAEYQRRYREENPEKERERARRRYEENREEIREWKRRYYEKNREERLELARRYREENREEMLERKRRYREENREVINAKISLHMAATREVSKALSTIQPYTPWSEQEDALLIADNGMTLYEKATQLGRTYSSCLSRRHCIRNLRRTTNA